MKTFKVVNRRGEIVAVLGEAEPPLNAPIETPRTISYWSEHRKIRITAEEFENLRVEAEKNK